MRLTCRSPTDTSTALLLLWFVLMFGWVSRPVEASCPCNTSAVWNALRQLFYSTNGPGWIRSDRWLAEGSTVCEWFGVLPDCTGVALPANALVGTLPSALANFTELRSLDLSNNSVRGTLPLEYHRWAAATNISLGQNALVGTLPTEYSAWSRVVSFDVSVNELSGVLPSEYRNWTSLKTFRVANNSLVGGLPTSYSEWGTSLEEFSIGYNRISATLPPEYAVFSSLRRFIVDGNLLWGTLPPQYRNWTQLTSFLFSTNTIGGSLPPEYAAFTRLEEIIGDYNYAVDGTLPPEYSTWTQLYTFSMAGNLLRGTLPPQYKEMKHLEFFQVSVNKLNGTLPPEYRAWVNLIEFSASLNQFTGTLPPEYASFSLMTLFHIAANQISGTLPPPYGVGWGSMAHLFVNTNQLHGTFPQEYGNMRNMEHFTADDNRLEGQLPSSLGQWSRLQVFGASGNRFNGTLPNSFANWPSGVAILLDNNRLTGSMPTEWSGKILFVLTLHNNWNLTGPIPATMSIPFVVTICNTSLCGTLPQTWSMGTTTRACQPVTSTLVNSVASGDFSKIVPVTTPLPTCPPTPAPTQATVAPPRSPGSDSANISAPYISSRWNEAVQASNGIATATLAVATILPLMTVGIPSGFSVGASVRVSSLASRVATRRLLCGSTSTGALSGSDKETDDDDAIGSFLGDNPTTLSLPGRLSLAGGTIVGNTLLLGVAPFVLGLAAVWIRRAVRMARERNAVDVVPPVGQPLALVRHCVRAHLVVYSWVAVPTTAAAVVLLEDGASGGGGSAAGFVGALGLCAVILPVALLASTWLRFRKLLTASVAAQQRRRSAAWERCDVVEYLSSERAAWAPLRRQERRSMEVGLPSRIAWCLLDESLRSCMFPHDYTFLVDFASSVAQGCLAGAASSPHTTCAAVGPLLWLLVSVGAVAALFEAIARPRATLLDQGVALVMVLWTALVSASASGGMSDVAAVAMVAQAVVALGFVVLQFVVGLLARSRAVVQRAAELTLQRTTRLAAVARRRAKAVQRAVESLFHSSSSRSSRASGTTQHEITSRHMAQLRSLRPTSAELLGVLIHMAVEHKGAPLPLPRDPLPQR